MAANPGRYTFLDAAISAEIRAEFARQTHTKTISEAADRMQMRRATLSNLINGRAPFRAGQLSALAEYLGTTAEAITEEAERQISKAMGKVA